MKLMIDLRMGVVKILFGNAFQEPFSMHECKRERKRQSFPSNLSDITDSAQMTKFVPEHARWQGFKKIGWVQSKDVSR